MKKALKALALTATMLFGAEKLAQAAPQNDFAFAPSPQIKLICADTQKACTDFLTALAISNNDVALEEVKKPTPADVPLPALENATAPVVRDFSLALGRQDKRVLPNGNTSFPSGPIITVRADFADENNEGLIQVTSPFEPDGDRGAPVHDSLFTFAHIMGEGPSSTVAAGIFGITDFDGLHLLSPFLETTTKIRTQLGAWKISTNASFDFLIGHDTVTYDGAMIAARLTHPQEIFRAQMKPYVELIALLSAQGEANLRYRSGVSLEIPTGEATSLSFGLEHNTPLLTADRSQVHPAATQGTVGIKVKL